MPDGFDPQRTGRGRRRAHAGRGLMIALLASLAMHAVLVGALMQRASPEPMETAAVEAIPIELIVPPAEPEPEPEPTPELQLDLPDESFETPPDEAANVLETPPEPELEEPPTPEPPPEEQATAEPSAEEPPLEAAAPEAEAAPEEAAPEEAAPEEAAPEEAAPPDAPDQAVAETAPDPVLANAPPVPVNLNIGTPEALEGARTAPGSPTEADAEEVTDAATPPAESETADGEPSAAEANDQPPEEAATDPTGAEDPQNQPSGQSEDPSESGADETRLAGADGTPGTATDEAADADSGAEDLAAGTRAAEPSSDPSPSASDESDLLLGPADFAANRPAVPLPNPNRPAPAPGARTAEAEAAALGGASAVRPNPQFAFNEALRAALAAPTTDPVGEDNPERAAQIAYTEAVRSAIAPRFWSAMRSVDASGIAVVEVVIRRSGAVRSARIVQASGIAELDEASLLAARSTTYPPLPASIRGDTLTVHIPLRVR